MQATYVLSSAVCLLMWNTLQVTVRLPQVFQMSEWTVSVTDSIPPRSENDEFFSNWKYF